RQPAIVAASLPGGEDIRRDLVGQGYHMHTVQIPAPDHELTASALHALLFAAGPDGPWHDGWATPETAAQAQHTSDQLTAIPQRPAHRAPPPPAVLTGRELPEHPQQWRSPRRPDAATPQRGQFPRTSITVPVTRCGSDPRTFAVSSRKKITPPHRYPVNEHNA